MEATRCSDGRRRVDAVVVRGETTLRRWTKARRCCGGEQRQGAATIRDESTQWWSEARRLGGAAVVEWQNGAVTAAADECRERDDKDSWTSRPLKADERDGRRLAAGKEAESRRLQLPRPRSRGSRTCLQCSMVMLYLQSTPS
ncbi:cytochrome P450 [Striga asiatica]|uniref:Cytochrome P450 n=1 Tax=Striga asiatica TaxID=4170 RepID=A0A5A7Q6D3_STRAF|nr:cytochrome P450 [Striga asiatica]